MGHAIADSGYFALTPGRLGPAPAGPNIALTPHTYPDAKYLL